MIVCTGSQGEPYSALSLMAAREHKWVKLADGDTVVLSSSLIPGNEPAIHRVVDALYRSGADVYHVPADQVHASGHAAQEELRLLLSLSENKLRLSLLWIEFEFQLLKENRMPKLLADFGRALQQTIANQQFDALAFTFLNTTTRKQSERA